jgi:hypothetical protein
MMPRPWTDDTRFPPRSRNAQHPRTRTVLPDLLNQERHIQCGSVDPARAPPMVGRLVASRGGLRVHHPWLCDDDVVKGLVDVGNLCG